MGEDSVPRLRRGSSFTRRPTEGEGRLRTLRRGSSFIGRRPEGEVGGEESSVPALRRGALKSSTGLLRAGTFAFESAGAGAEEENKVVDEEGDGGEMREFESVDGGEGAKQVCGMCAGCGVGSKAMPPWAPERLKGMSEGERVAVWRELQQKEEMGRLEKELRRKRLKDMEEVERRTEIRRGEELVEEEVEEKEVGPGEDSGRMDELEIVDLGTDKSRSSSRGSRRRSRSSLSGEDVSESVKDWKGRKERGSDEECGQCEELEGKVKDLEEQLGVLREVVTVCGNEEVNEEVKKPKSWKNKVMSAYFGTSVGTDKQRLKQEVDALRKATNFLFRKLQNGEAR